MNSAGLLVLVLVAGLQHSSIPPQSISGHHVLVSLGTVQLDLTLITGHGFDAAFPAPLQDIPRTYQYECTPLRFHTVCIASNCAWSSHPAQGQFTGRE